MINLLRFYTNIKETFEIGSLIYAVFTDFKIKFDSININRLIVNLQNLGMVDSLCSWFESYLHDRKQQVRIWRNISIKFDTHSDGGHLSPLLFLIFFNDIRFNHYFYLQMK